MGKERIRKYLDLEFCHKGKIDISILTVEVDVTT